MGNQDNVSFEDGQENNVSHPKRETRNIIMVAAVVIVLLAAAGIGVWLYMDNQKPTSPDQSQGQEGPDGSKPDGTIPDDEAEIEEYPPVDFITPEMRAKYNSIYRTQGLYATKLEVYKDFEEHGVEFNWGNPNHTSVLNFDEEVSQ